MKRSRLLRMRPEREAPIRITVSVLQGRSFHLLPTPYVLSHLRRDPGILRKWFPVTLGRQRPYVVTLAGQDWQHAVSVSR
jgi:hypothetical protein